ncbi:MAG: hypothetical protein KGP28_08060 [Bdellovibrionales bacterium]|nr:hypothetical protein [Bdellovibrionales bacterium]
MMLETILDAISGLENEQILRCEFSSESPGWCQGFIRAVDQSPHSLQDWLKAHDAFLRWAKKNCRDIPLHRRQEYLCCALEGMKDPAGNFSLESTLLYFLEQNGVEY